MKPSEERALLRDVARIADALEKIAESLAMVAARRVPVAGERRTEFRAEGSDLVGALERADAIGTRTLNPDA